MRKFEFPLRSVLRLRRFAESQAKQALMEAVAGLREAEEALAATERRIVTQTRRLSDSLREMSAAEVVIAWQELEQLDQLALKQRAAVAEWESVVARRQEAWLAARRERIPLERLEEQLREAHYREVESVEQAVTDELAMIGHSRRGNDP